jgi:protein AFG1
MSPDPLLETAIEVGNEAMCIFLDEFQVTDIADAMILKRLFELLWQKGVILITTSNRAPEDLYQNGIQRASFLPFIPLLRVNCQVIPIQSEIDYRHQLIQKEKEYFARLYYGQCEGVEGETIFQTYFNVNNAKDSKKFK